jgi:hypothetical protein
MACIKVLSPIGVVRSTSVSVPSLPADFAGRTVGFLDNTKANFDRLVGEIGTILKERFGVARVLHLRKTNASMPAAPDILAALTKECDVVFAGSAD